MRQLLPPRGLGFGLLLSAGLVLFGAGCGGPAGAAGDEPQAVGDTGTALGGATVVTAATLETHGAIAGRFVPDDVADASLIGNCDPSMWANFGLSFAAGDWQRIDVALMTRDPIATGQTGEIPLDWMDVSFNDAAFDTHQFRGKGTLDIEVHDADKASRRMRGVVHATGLAGRDAAEGQSLDDASLAFDIAFSCGTR
ncbi:MAG: hypothetical protein AB7V01_22410 [Vicinamibacterales bacterium]